MKFCEIFINTFFTENLRSITSNDFLLGFDILQSLKMTDSYDWLNYIFSELCTWSKKQYKINYLTPYKKA